MREKANRRAKLTATNSSMASWVISPADMMTPLRTLRGRFALPRAPGAQSRPAQAVVDEVGTAVNGESLSLARSARQQRESSRHERGRLAVSDGKKREKR